MVFERYFKRQRANTKFFALTVRISAASYLMRAFAAQGIIVAAVEHTDGTASFTQSDDGRPQILKQMYSFLIV